MLTEKDREYAKKRKRMWDCFGWTYRGINDLSKNHSLNCGCGICRARTHYKKLKRKQDRKNARHETKKIQRSEY